MKIVRSIFSWLVTLLVPLALTFLGLRLMLTHAFLQLEYRVPGFPADTYGFTQADRLHWAPYAVDYLINNAGISYLGDLTFAGGNPLFNERELSHMHDVKNVVRPSLLIGYLSWVVLLAVALSAWFGKWSFEYLRGLKRGGWLTVGLVVAIGLFAAISFDTFFTEFHALFFVGNSWQFYYSDTLIRLFPMRFWSDAFLYAGVLALAIGLALGLGLRPKAAHGVQ
jgi:integral membrane protein (TIGR01906 family)